MMTLVVVIAFVVVVAGLLRASGCVVLGRFDPIFQIESGRCCVGTPWKNEEFVTHGRRTLIPRRYLNAHFAPTNVMGSVAAPCARI